MKGTQAVTAVIALVLIVLTTEAFIKREKSLIGTFLAALGC
ncbi:MAG: hypothetical protein ACYDHD_05455 [Vulcanimicrobiaceae bacterium]